MNFSQILKDSYTKPILVDFWSPTCGPCVQLKQELEKIKPQISTPIVEINVMENTDIAVEQGVMGLPSLRLYLDGKVLDQQSSFMTADQILKWLHSYV